MAQFTVPPFPQNGTGGLPRRDSECRCECVDAFNCRYERLGQDTTRNRARSNRGLPKSPHWNDQLADWRAVTPREFPFTQAAVSKADEANARARTGEVTRNMVKEWRIFCAVELPEDVRAQLRDHVLQLRKEIPDVAASWSRVENIHLTLKFFGNVAVDRISTISDAASRAVKEFSPFEIGIGTTGVFPKPSRAQVLWIGVSDPSGKLVNFATEIGR